MSNENQLTKPECNTDEFRCFFVTDTTAEHIVHAESKRVFFGQPKRIVEMKISGCGVELPNLWEQGLFFISGNEAIPIYAHEGDVFARFLEEAIVLWGRSHNTSDANPSLNGTGQGPAR